MRKNFDRELYNIYDAKAKEAAHLIFETSGGYYLEESEKKTDVDFLIFDPEDNHIGYLEVEIKKAWVTKEFQYNDINWPERKAKYCTLDLPTIFLIFSNELDNYLTTSSKVLLKSPLEIVRNKYIPYGEKFFKVPKTKVIFNDIFQNIVELL